MSLRANTYAALVGAAFLAIAFIFVATIYAARVWVHSGERLAATSAMAQVRRAVDAELESMDRNARDWGAWSDAVEFAQGRDPGFEESNFTSSTLETLDLDVLGMFDASGKPLARLNSTELVSDVVAYRAYEALTARGSRLLHHDGPSSFREVVRIGDQAIMIVSRPIIAPDETGPVRGAVVMGRLLNQKRADRVGRVADVPVTVRQPDDPGIPSDTRQALAAGGSGGIAIHVTRPLDLVGYTQLNDPSGRPVVVLSALRQPMFFATAVRTIAALLGVFLIGGLIWALVAFNIVEATSLSRISWLGGSIHAIARRGDFSSRIDVAGQTVLDEAGRVAVQVNRMLDALERAHRQMVEGEIRHQVLVENMPDAVFTLAPSGRFTYLNPQAEQLLGMTSEELLGSQCTVAVGGESIAAVEERLIRCVDEPNLRPLEVTFVDARGRAFPVELSISPVCDEEGVATSIHWIARDITERRRFEEQLIHFANHDHLTGLYNRRRFEEELVQHLARVRRHGGGGALLWLDLDHFKEINDSHGHGVGDDLLASVASILSDRSREEQTLARLGGDEFAMLLPYADEQEAVNAAERVLRELNAGVPLTGGVRVQVKASVGIALFPAHATGVDELLLRADIAMYRAKETGRNRIAVFSPGELWPEQLVHRRAWGERIEEALAYDRFQVFAQPILELRTSRIAGYELLVRMITPEGEVCSPDEFLAAAEDLGLVGEIDRWMVTRAARLASRIAPDSPGVTLFVNLSAKTLADSTFPDLVRRLLAEEGVPPASLGFELTETALVSNMTRARDFVQSLRGIGCLFALDDYGSGFSSLSYLRSMPVDLLKIDGSLIRDLRTCEQDRHLVRAIIELARCLDIRVTAEYVEYEETLGILKGDGVDFAQGFFIGRPAPAEELLGIGDDDIAEGRAAS